MTKLVEWLFGILVCFVLWMILVTKKINLNISEEWNTLILFLPLHTVVLFGMWSLGVVLWRVYSFNDCPEAERELLQQIKVAKEDLKLKGLRV